MESAGAGYTLRHSGQAEAGVGYGYHQGGETRQVDAGQGEQVAPSGRCGQRRLIAVVPGDQATSRRTHGAVVATTVPVPPGRRSPAAPSRRSPALSPESARRLPRDVCSRRATYPGHNPPVRRSHVWSECANSEHSCRQLRDAKPAPRLPVDGVPGPGCMVSRTDALVGWQNRLLLEIVRR